MLEWLECDEAPELGASLVMPPDGFEGAWWEAEALDGSSLYVFVAGDGGAVPMNLTVYVVPGDAENHGRRFEGGRWAEVRPGDRYPTLPELWSVADRFALPGAFLMPCGPGDLPSIAVAGSEPPPFAPGDGTCFQMKQGGALPGSMALRRMQLAGTAASLIVKPGA